MSKISAILGVADSLRKRCGNQPLLKAVIHSHWSWLLASPLVQLARCHLDGCEDQERACSLVTLNSRHDMDISSDLRIANP